MKKENQDTENQPAATGVEQSAAFAQREHNSSLGNVWIALTGADPAKLMPQIVATVLQEGGTRPPWKWIRNKTEYVAMAWPQDQPIRACVIMAGPEGSQLKPVTATPLLEGLPNDLTVDRVEPREEGMGADVGVEMPDSANPLWFFDPFYTRDETDLTPGVTHTFWLSGIALGVRRAMLDHVSMTQGPAYDAHAQNWLATHRDSTPLDVPPLKIEVAGKHFIMPGHFYCEYQFRATVEKVEDYHLEKMPIKVLYLSFPFNSRPPLRIPLFASRFVLGDYAPEAGHEIEAHAWLQGRIIDLESNM